MNNSLYKLLVIILAIVNIILLRPALTMMSRGAPQLFPLNDNSAEYKLKKASHGEYTVEYRKGFAFYSALIGSTQVPLDEFDGKVVKITGEYRPILGTPTCYKRCTDIPYRATLIDIHDINLAE